MISSKTTSIRRRREPRRANREATVGQQTEKSQRDLINQPDVDAQRLRRENVPQNNSFSASDGEKVAAGRMR
jgi:hypothetical protein